MFPTAFGPSNPPALMPTPCDVLLTDGTARLLKFRRSGAVAPKGGLPVLLIPSLINRWYVLDLRAGATLAGSLVEQGFEVYCLDWGIPEDEDRYFSWDDVLARLLRMTNAVRRIANAPRVGMLGYCIGGTLAAIHTALHPETIASLVNLAGPIDFAHAGFLGHMVQPRWFDPAAIAGAGNVSANQMQQGFQALRPTQNLAKFVGIVDRGHDELSREAFNALEAWASDNIPFPAAAYETYIRELYQQNRLVAGEHAVAGQRVELSKITQPLLTVVTSRDVICPPKAAEGLNACARSTDSQVLVVPGGHVGAVVGGRAPTILYPALAKFFGRTLCS